MSGVSNIKPSLSIGIEEEYQTVDPVTRDLRSHIHAEIVEKGRLILEERVKPEMHQSVVEIGTGVCQNIEEARAEIRDIRRQIITLAKDNGLRLAAGGTHPFAQWREQEIYPDARYHTIVEDLKMVARANLIFGLHVHIGVEDRETAIQLMNGARYFLPHLLALSANSPFWVGMETGLRSYRCKVFDKFPRTNIPDLYSQLERIRKLRQPADPHQLHRQRQEDLVGHTPAPATSPPSSSASATCRCASKRPSRSPRCARPSSPSSITCTKTIRASAITAARSSWRTSGAPRATASMAR